MQSIILVVIIILIIIILSGSGYYFLYKGNGKVDQLKPQMMPAFLQASLQGSLQLVPYTPKSSLQGLEQPVTLAPIDNECTRLHNWEAESFPKASSSEANLLNQSYNIRDMAMKMIDEYEMIFVAILNDRIRQNNIMIPVHNYMLDMYITYERDKIEEFKMLYTVINLIFKYQSTRTWESVLDQEFVRVRRYIMQDTGLNESVGLSNNFRDMMSPDHFSKRWPFYKPSKAEYYSKLESNIMPLYTYFIKRVYETYVLKQPI